MNSNRIEIMLRTLVGTGLSLLLAGLVITPPDSILSSYIPVSDAARFFVTQSLVVLTLLGPVRWYTRIALIVACLIALNLPLTLFSWQGSDISWWFGLQLSTLSLTALWMGVLRFRGWTFTKETQSKGTQSEPPSAHQFSILALLLMMTAAAGVATLVRLTTQMPLEERWWLHFLLVPLGFSAAFVGGINVILRPQVSWQTLALLCVGVPAWGLLIPVAFSGESFLYVLMMLWLASYMLTMGIAFFCMRGLGVRYERRELPLASSMTTERPNSVATSAV